MSAEPEIRFAVAMNGGVSLAIWIGGVCDELLRMCVDGDDASVDLDAASPALDWTPYQVACWVAKARPRVDVMAGASAGGLNSVFLALGLIHGHQNLRALRDLWIENGNLDDLLRNPFDAAPPSLMMGDEFFLPRLTEAIASLLPDGPSSGTALDRPMQVALTATSLRGHVRRMDLSLGDDATEKTHQTLLVFRHKAHGTSGERPSDFVASGTTTHDRRRVVARLARACRSTASFPGAFEPSAVAIAGAGDDTAATDALLASNFQLPARTKLPENDLLIDGGTLVNLPVAEALEAVFNQRSDGPVRRVFAMVVPDPSMATEAPDAATATLTEVISGALSTIPRNQTVHASIDGLDTHNKAVAALWEARAHVLALDTAARKTIAEGLFPAYRARRQMVRKNMIGRHLAARLDQSNLDPVTRALWLAYIARPAFDTTTVPVTLDHARDDDLARWSSSTVRRSAARLLTLVRELERKPGRDAAQVNRARTDINAVLTESGDLALADSNNMFEDADLTMEMAASLDAVELSWRNTGAISARLRRLGGVAFDLRTSGVGGTAVATLTSAADGLALLLQLEVIEQSFGGFGHVLEQHVETVRIDGVCESPLDSSLRRNHPAGKVAGVQLGHFGSFLKASWRANDWMWGRLDGSRDLIDVLLAGADPARVAEASRVLTVPAGANDPTAALRDHLVKLRHTDVVLDEAAAIKGAIESDVANGAPRLRTTRVLEREIDDVASASTGELESRITAASRVLSANRIGSETIADYAGSDLVLRVSTQTLAVGSTIIKQSSPKLLRGALATARYVALLAWGFVKGALGGPVVRTFAGIAFGVGAGIVAILLFTGSDIGVLGPVGIALFAAGVLVGCARAPAVCVPLLVLGAVPLALAELPTDEQSWWPSTVGWPSLQDHSRLLPISAFAVAIVGIGLARRPMWARAFTVDLAAARRRLIAQRNVPAAVGALPLYPAGVTTKERVFRVVMALAGLVAAAMAGTRRAEGDWTWSAKVFWSIATLMAIGCLLAIEIVRHRGSRDASDTARPDTALASAAIPPAIVVAISSLVAALVGPGEVVDVSDALGVMLAAVVVAFVAEGVVLPLVVRGKWLRLLVPLAGGAGTAVIALWLSHDELSDDSRVQWVVFAVLAMAVGAVATQLLTLLRYRSRMTWGPLLTASAAALAFFQFAAL